MGDYSELKRLAEAATPGRVHDRLDSCGGGLKYECFGDDGSLVLKVDHKNDEWGFIGDRGAEDEAFFLACTPAVVLGLIAANEKLAEDYDKAWRHDLNDKNNVEAMVGELAGAQAMLETAYSERDQLKAEVETLRKIISESASACGAAVSVECSLEFMSMLPGEIASVIGKLRHECAARHPFRPAVNQPLIGYTGCVICGQFTDHQGLPCPNTRAFAMSKESGHD